MKKILYSSISNELVLDFARNRLGNRVIVLMYHELAEDNDHTDAWTIVKKSEFIRQMEYLKAHFEVVSLKEAITRKGGEKLQKPLAVITFDDGYAGNKNILLPIVKSMGLPVSIFIATGATISGEIYWYDKIITAVRTTQEIALDLRERNLGCYSINRTTGAANWAEIQKLLMDLKELEPVERDAAVNHILELLKTYKRAPGHNIGHMTEQDITEMAGCDLITFGAHSHCHSMLPQLQPEALSESIMRSRKLLEKWTGRPVMYFAYPSGAYNEKVIDVLKACEFECSLTTRSKPWDKEPLLEIPRIGIGRFDSFDFFKLRVSDALKLAGRN